MASAVRVIYDMREDTRTREEARMREKTINDWNNGMMSAKMEGRAEGIAKNRAEMIKSMEANGLPQELIEKIINGLPR